MRIVLKKSNLILSGGVLLLLTTFSHASVFQGKIVDFHLLSCQSLRCFQLQSKVAYVSALDGNYAFDRASLILENRVVESADVYYDRKMKKVFLRDVAGADFVYDVATGVLKLYGQ